MPIDFNVNSTIKTSKDIFVNVNGDKRQVSKVLTSADGQIVSVYQKNNGNSYLWATLLDTNHQANVIYANNDFSDIRSVYKTNSYEYISQLYSVDKTIYCFSCSASSSAMNVAVSTDMFAWTKFACSGFSSVDCSKIKICHTGAMFVGMIPTSSDATFYYSLDGKVWRTLSKTSTSPKIPSGANIEYVTDGTNSKLIVTAPSGVFATNVSTSQLSFTKIYTAPSGINFGGDTQFDTQDSSILYSFPRTGLVNYYGVITATPSVTTRSTSITTIKRCEYGGHIFSLSGKNLYIDNTKVATTNLYTIDNAVGISLEGEGAFLIMYRESASATNRNIATLTVDGSFDIVATIASTIVVQSGVRKILVNPLR